MGEIDEIFGSTLCGVILTGWLFGIICVLTYQYFSQYHSDPLSTRILVGTVFVLQLFNIFNITVIVYYYLVHEYGNPAALTRATWNWSAYLGLESVTATLVQLYYSYRVLKLTRSWLATIAAVVLSFCQLGFGIGTMLVTILVNIFANFTPWTWVCVVWLGCSAACDILVTSVQVWFLRKNDTKINGTDRLVKTLVLYIVSTGVLTSVVAILELSTFAALGFNFVHVFLSQPNGSFYVISLLANLVVRKSLRQRTHVSGTIGGGSTARSETRLDAMQFKAIRMPFSTGTSGSTIKDQESLTNASSYKAPDLMMDPVARESSEV